MVLSKHRKDKFRRKSSYSDYSSDDHRSSTKERSYRNRRSDHREKKYETDRDRTKQEIPKKFRFDPPPLSYEFKQRGISDKSDDILHFSNLLPSLSNKTPEEIITELSQAEEIKRRLRKRTESKIFISNIPSDISEQEVVS